MTDNELRIECAKAMGYRWYRRPLGCGVQWYLSIDDMGTGWERTEGLGPAGLELSYRTPDYACDIAAAWKLVEAANLSLIHDLDGWHAVAADSISHGIFVNDGRPYIELIGSVGGKREPSDTPMRAICCAFLAAKGKI